jgi:PIN domain
MNETARELQELRVVLDTNAIYQAEGHELLRPAVSELIKVSVSHRDVTINWYLPEVVRNEREQQLRELARKSVPALERLERVCGISLGITDRIITERLRQRIEAQIAQLNLRILPVDPSAVDWSRMMSDAAFRQPPFSAGENEKGFRDALIAEAAGQLIESSSNCRIAIVTGDELLTKALVSRMTGKRQAAWEKSTKVAISNWVATWR